MEAENQTTTNEFIIVGFFDIPKLQIPLFVALTLIYPLTLVGNLLIMVIVYCNRDLHTPMYFFLTNLSFIDIIYTTTIAPKMLAQAFQDSAHVSLSDCVVQIYFFLATMSVELILLSLMAYDRYVAICSPLRYMTIMNKAVCIQMAAGSWIVGLLDALPHSLLLSRLSYCESHTINHFFCDVTALMTLSCTSTRTIEATAYGLGTLIGFLPFIFIITSYINIISAVLKIQSSKGRHKVFSTCVSHLTVVILFYGSICSTYMRPKSTQSMYSNKLMSLSYIAVTPLCNPIIYSLKNKDIKKALMKTWNNHKK
ncbi:olfactory receptor 5V1-like [Ambystoma mexicanum]|uniref:olfactory receptor 5V1-like n=1 Tax=Ambystoma mexicanum TaxID=8296 RepID=UPI0037E7F222